jgi:hypothetical protein
MAEAIKKLGLDLKSLDDLILNFGNDVVDTATHLKTAVKSFGDLGKAVQTTTALSEKTGVALKALGATAAGTAFGIFSLVDVASKLEGTVKIAFKAEAAFRDLNDSTRAMNFEQAILGTDTLSKSFDILEASSGTALDNIVTGFNAAFNSAKFQEMSGRAVSAYAAVEEAAYRVGTVSVQGSQRAIDTLEQNIATTRKLQEATKNATSSVETLNAQYDIASAGFVTQGESVEVGTASINLSQAGFGEVSSSTDAVVKVLRALGDEADDASLRAGQLFETTKVGLVTLNQLTGVIGPLSVQSKQLGIDFSEISAALAGLTTQGVSASEGATRLEALFNEITNASAATNAQLAAFRDEAGKPIQLNAAVLKDKGIAGVIADLKTATGGNVSNIQKLFSTKEAVEAVQLLLSLGEDALTSYTKRIDEVDPTSLGTEAAGRTKTITGSFNSAKNRASSQVEEFGKGLGVDVVQAVENADGVFAKFATGSAESVGVVSGTITGLSNKIKTIGGFIATAFTIAAPLAFATFITKAVLAIIPKIGKMVDAMKETQFAGESIWQTLERKAEEGLAYVLARWEAMLKRVTAQAKVAGAEMRHVLEGGPKPFGPALPPKPVIDVDAPSKTTVKVLESIGGAARGSSVAITKGFGLAKNIIGTTSKFLGTLGVGAAAALVGFSVLSGNVASFAQLLDKRTNPALQTARENLQGLENVAGLSALLDDLDPLTARLDDTSYAQGVLNDLLARGSKLWSDLTGSSRTYFKQTLPELNKLGEALKATNDISAAQRDKGILGTQSVGAKSAETKIKLGITLDSDDTQALEQEVKEKQAQLAASVKIEEQKLSEGKNKLKPEAYEAAQAELKTLKATVAEETKAYDLALKKKLVEQDIQRFKAIDTSVPLTVSLADNTEQGVKAQIGQITSTLSQANGAVLLDPEKFAADFADIQDQLKSTTSSINLGVKVDVTSAQSLRDELIASVGATDFAKFIASNPQFRDQFAQLNQAITDELVKQTDTNVSAQTTALKNAGANLNSGQAVVIRADIELDGISDKAKALATELSRPETSLARQQDIIAQIEQLEAQRSSLGLEKRIAQELGGRKQELTLAEALFNVKSAELSLLDKQSKFGGLSVSSAQLKLKAATEELAVKKEQIALAGKEASIKGESAAASIAEAEKRLNKNQSATLGKAPTGADREAFVAKQAADTATRSKAIAEERDLKLAEVTASSGKFSKEDQAKIVDAYTKSTVSLELKKDIKGNLFDEEGRLRDKDKTQAALSKAAGSRIAGFDGRRKAGEAVNTILDKGLEENAQKSDITKTAAADLKALETKTKQELEARDRIAKTVSSKVKEATQIDFSTKATAPAESGGSAVSTDAALAATKLQEQVNNALGTTAERFKILEASLDAEFASRDKLIVQTDLAAKSLSTIAGNASLFGDSLAGAKLDLLSLVTRDSAGALTTEADKEIERIQATVAAFVDQLDTAKTLLAGAKAGGATPETIKALEEAVANGQANVTAVSKEATGDIAFVKQQKEVQLLGAAAEIASKKILVENKAREQASIMANKTEEALASLSSAAGFADSVFGDALATASAQNKAGRNENATRAKGEVDLVNERLRTLQNLAKTDPNAAKLLPGAKAEATKEIASINKNAQLGDLTNRFAAERSVIDQKAKADERRRTNAEARDSSVSSLASSGVLSGSSAAAALDAQVAERKAERGSGRSAATSEIALITNQLNTIRELAKTDATAAKLLPAAEKDAESRIATKRLEGEFADLESRLAASSKAVEAEYSTRLDVVSRNQELISSLSSLSSVAGSLFANSSLSATLNRLGTDLESSSGKLSTEYSKELALIAARNKGLDDAVKTAENSGADPETVAGLKRAKALDDVQGQAEKSALAQKLKVDSLTQSLAVMDSKVKEVSDVIAKQAALYTEQLDFERRQTESKGLNNKSGAELQKSLVNFLGQNNGATDIINQRLDFQQAEDDAKLSKAANVSDAKKEIIDITVLKSQLEIEQRSYENALTQTMLLSDIVTVLSGGEAQTDTVDIMAQLPALIAQSQAQAGQRADLLNQKEAFVSKELEGKNTAIDRDTTSRQLGILGSNINPANIDLITKALDDSQSQLNAFKREEIKVGSLSDSGFKQQLANINGIKDSFINNALPRQAPTAQTRPATNVQLTSPVSISVSVPTGSNVDKGQIERMINTQINPAIKRGMDKVSDSLLKYANTF